MLVLKLFHVFFAISFMAGVFYLPRLIVHYKLASENNEATTRLMLMMVKLYRFSFINGIIAIATGIALGYIYFGWKGIWLNLKLMVVVILFIYFCFCIIKIKKAIKLSSQIDYTSKFWRIYNEIAVLILISLLYIVIFKPNF